MTDLLPMASAYVEYLLLALVTVAAVTAMMFLVALLVSVVRALRDAP